MVLSFYKDINGYWIIEIMFCFILKRSYQVQNLYKSVNFSIVQLQLFVTSVVQSFTEIKAFWCKSRLWIFKVETFINSIKKCLDRKDVDRFNKN